MKRSRRPSGAFCVALLVALFTCSTLRLYCEILFAENCLAYNVYRGCNFSSQCRRFASRNKIAELEKSFHRIGPRLLFIFTRFVDIDETISNSTHVAGEEKRRNNRGEFIIEPRRRIKGIMSFYNRERNGKRKDKRRSSSSYTTQSKRHSYSDYLHPHAILI